MLSTTKCILPKYKFLVMHMFDEQTSNTIVKGNLDLLCDVETFMGLSCISYLPMNLCNLCQNLLKFKMYSFVILLMYLRLVKKNCTNHMLIQLQTIGMLMEFFKYSLQLCIIHHYNKPWLSKGSP
jgi:hypothetical protein